MMTLILEYAKQPSTYKGLGILLGLAGVTVAPGAFEVIGAGIITAIGVWETFRNERKKK